MKKPMIAAALALSLTFASSISVFAAPASTIPATQITNTAVPTVADAAMYRGTVASISVDGDINYITLKQEKGTNYGYPVKQFKITADTKTDYTKDQLELGSYLEVAYGSSSNIEEVSTAITASLLNEAEFSVYNGTVVSVTPVKGSADEGSILLKDKSSNNQTVFHYNKDTQLYIDKKALKKGAVLNIYHSGALTRSVPPQGNALEIRAYSDVKVYRGNITKVSTKKGITTLNLKRAAGTDFSNTLTVTLNSSVKSNVAIKDLKKNNYVEVSYDSSSKKPLVQTISKLMDSEYVVKNAKVTAITPSADDSTSGSITVVSLTDKQEIVFHYSSLTNFKKPLADIKVGDSLSLYHSGIMTMSLPPQCFALDISKYIK